MYFIVKMWLTPVRVVISDKLLKNIHNLFLNMKHTQQVFVKSKPLLYYCNYYKYLQLL